MISQRLTFLAVAMVSLVVVGVSYYFYSVWSVRIISPGPCPIPAPPIQLRTHVGSGEMVFVTDYSQYRYSNNSPQAPVSVLGYELAVYRQGDDYLGSGEIIQEGRLDSLNTTGDFQFHDMEAEGEFSPGNDFFILVNPPPLTVQLRILDSSGKAIAWNSIVGCA